MRMVRIRRWAARATRFAAVETLLHVLVPGAVVLTAVATVGAGLAEIPLWIVMVAALAVAVVVGFLQKRALWRMLEEERSVRPAPVASAAPERASEAESPSAVADLDELTAKLNRDATRRLIRLSPDEQEQEFHEMGRLVTRLQRAYWRGIRDE